MSRVLFATIGSLGDLHPLIGIGLELQRRGHVVRFCTSETYRSRLESLGFGFDALRPDATPENEAVAGLVREIMDPKRGVELLLRRWILPELRATYDDLLKAVTGPPRIDLLLSGELVYPAALIAEKTGVAWATCITTPMSFFSAHDPPILPPVPVLSSFLRRFGPGLNGALIRLVKFSTRHWGEPVQALRRELGLARGPNPIYEGKFSPSLVLAMFSAALAAPQPDWPPNTVITGFPFYDGPTDGPALPSSLEEFLRGDEPPIVFTLGSSAVLDPGSFYGESARAASLLRRRAVLLLGANPPPANLSDGVATAGYARFSELFPRSAAVVHQGGVGTTGQALRAGRPMLVMPFNFDQPDNAARVARLGAGQVIRRSEYRANRVAGQLQQILEATGYRECAQRISQTVRKENGAETACLAIERLLR
ncbi:MAG TPA: glycosyltransferase [Verrucomicrobiae bacterium]|nr:glycosyltransferase [Verrucomicrobiae bacterium]